MGLNVPNILNTFPFLNVPDPVRLKKAKNVSDVSIIFNLL